MIYRVEVTGEWRRAYGGTPPEAHDEAYRVNAITAEAAELAARQLFAATAASTGAVTNGCEARAAARSGRQRRAVQMWPAARSHSSVRAMPSTTPTAGS